LSRLFDLFFLGITDTVSERLDAKEPTSQLYFISIVYARRLIHRIGECT
jgi:hypothetical protein